MITIQKIRLDGFLSFAPGSPEFELRDLNVLIGPNGSGKSNFIEALELLSATPSNLAKVVRVGGGAGEWIWKGDTVKSSAEIDVVLKEGTPTGRPIRYRIELTEVGNRLEVIDEAIEEVEPVPGKSDVFFYYRFQRGRPMISVRDSEAVDGAVKRQLQRAHLAPDQSVLGQRKDPEQYPEVTWTGQRLGSIQTFREWTFGRSGPLRTPQSALLPEDQLLVDNSNLALLLNEIEHAGGVRFDILLRDFFPRFQRMSTRISGGAVQFYLHETDFDRPISATRLSDGTLRFIALLALLLSPSPPPLLCIEEPELGLHPDAVALVADLLVDASKRTQLIVTTHSDALVSALTNQPDAIVACERPGAGTELRRLDPKKLAVWLDDYRLGDLWRMGELGANP